MPMAGAERVNISGVAMASLMDAVARASGDFDGLMFGQATSRDIATLQDSAELRQDKVHEAYISGFCCCAGICSFYSPSCVVSETQLANLAAPFSEPVLGWLSYRTGLWSRPSLREHAVSSKLRDSLDSLQQEYPGLPTFFALLWSETAHGGATTSIQLQLFRLVSSTTGWGHSNPVGHPPVLIPIPLVLDNMGTALAAHRSYDAISPLASASLRVTNLTPQTLPASSKSAHTASAAVRSGSSSFSTTVGSQANPSSSNPGRSQRQSGKAGGGSGTERGVSPGGVSPGGLVRGFSGHTPARQPTEIAATTAGAPPGYRSAIGALLLHMGVEEMYEQMLARLEGLVQDVSVSHAAVQRAVVKLTAMY